MRHLILKFLVSILASATSSAAFACMADGPEGYVSGLIWQQKHQEVPENAMLLKVKVTGPLEAEPFALVADILEGPEKLVGTALNFVPKSWTSCVGLGRLEGYIVVEKEPESLASAPEIRIYKALDYLPAAEDRSHGFEPSDNWFIPGARAPELRIPAEAEEGMMEG